MRKAVCIATAAVIAILGCAGCSNSTPTIAHSNIENTTNSNVKVPVGGTAAKAEGFEVTEQEVADYITQYRLYAGAEDDSTWASLLDKAGMTAEDVRNQAIDNIALSKAVAAKAASMGIEVSDDEMKQIIEDRRSETDSKSDSTWLALLQTSGYADQASYEEDVRNAVLLERLFAAENPAPSVSEAALAQFSYDHVDAYLGVKTVSIAYPSYASAAASAAVSKFSENANASDFRDFAANQVDNGTAEQVSEDGWSCLSTTISSYAEAALKDAHAGTAVMYTEADGTIKVAFVLEEYQADRNGRPDFNSMPKEIKNRLNDDYVNTTRAQNMSAYVSSLLTDAKIQVNPMPKGLPYDVSMDLSTYGTETTAEQDAEEAQKLIDEHINELSLSGYDSNGNLISENYDGE